jgi:DNA-binding CsgD family transcriptional regulator
VSEGPDPLNRIRLRLDDAGGGAGAVVYIEGALGSGKTQLIAATAEAARAAGMRVLQAQGRLLEREFPFGVALQLFEEMWFEAGAGARRSLLEGPARRAGELLSGAPPAGPALGSERVYGVIHSLFWLARSLASDRDGATSTRPLALLVDDVECVDGPSLHFLAYLSSRIGRLPIAAVVAGRPEGLSPGPPALSALHSASEILRLTQRGIGVAMTDQTRSASAEGPRASAAHAALRKSLAGGHRESVLDLAELAWSDGALLESDADADAWPAVTGALVFIDELERAVAVARAATGSGRAGDPPGAVQWQGWSLYHQGRITEALALAEAARAVHGSDLVPHGLIAGCRLAQGRVDEAEAALSLFSGDNVEEIDGPLLLDLRAQLRLAQLRPVDALTDALEAGRRCRGERDIIGPGAVAWRSTAALARLALGDAARGRSLAEEELELARQQGLTRVVIRDLRVLAFAAKGARVLDLLAEAVRIGRGAPPRLEYMTALVDLGAATRRANQRSAARHPLRMGLELAERHGAAALARRAREELGATGARSRRVILSGIQALTPGERRVADLAARGLTTRQIAQVLFVTPKTVEYHLRHVYRKLDIPSSRADLARALSTATAG